MENQSGQIYLIDDDPSVRAALCRLIGSAGFKVESFSSPQIFLDSVPLNDARGVLILDLRMPGTDGFALQKKLKEFRCDLRILFITGHAQPGDRDHAMREGAIGFLLKPFNDESLLELINGVFTEDR